MKRIRALAVAVICLPTALSAQQSPAPAHRPPNGVVLSFLDFGGHYGGLLLAAFDSIPESKYGYRPRPPQQSIGYIAQHLENANYVLCERIGGMKHPTGPKDSLADTIKATWPTDLAEHYSQLASYMRLMGMIPPSAPPRPKR